MADLKPREFPTLGDRIRRGRERLAMTQKALGLEVGARSTGGELVQSYVARIEDGQVLPTKEVLVAISEALDISHDRLTAAIIRDRLAKPGREEIVYPLEKGIVTLSELAQWEGSAAHNEVWLVAERYVDDHFREFEDAVSKIVRRGGTFIFFLPPGYRSEIDTYRSEIYERANQDGDSGIGKLLYIELTLDQMGLIAASFVIANPLSDWTATDGERYPNGYLIINDDLGEPCMGIKMSFQECRPRVRFLKAFYREQIKHSSAPLAEAAS